MADAVSAQAVTVPSTNSTERWGLAAKGSFRFAFVYLILYCWPEAGRSNLLDAIPNFGVGSMNDADSLSLTNV
jgi:hypothetical protein